MATKGTVSGVIANMVTLVVDGPGGTERDLLYLDRRRPIDGGGY